MEGLLERLRGVPWEALPPAAVDAVGRVLSGRPAERELDRFLRGLSAQARAATAEAVFGVALWRRRLSCAVPGGGARALLFVFLRDFAGVPQEHAAKLADLPEPWPERTARPARLADRWSLPDWIETALLRDLGADAEAFAAAMCAPGPICLRANPLRTSRDGLAVALRSEGIETRPAPRAPYGLLVSSPRPNLLGSRAMRDGWLEVQDEGSQLVAGLVEARPGETILDLCAGAGGKTLALAGDLRNQGRLLAWEPDPERRARLVQRAARAGARAEVLRSPPDGLGADAVLADVPCSELGILRRGPDARWLLREEDALRMPAIQREILECALRNVRRGGRLVYATCTVRREENEDLARGFERAHPDLRRDATLELFPHRDGTDGFFAVRWIVGEPSHA
jgi:16S rRNA (cytosine967-C5)-methyltransferase